VLLVQQDRKVKRVCKGNRARQAPMELQENRVYKENKV
jgi:hypothetical protein